MAKTPSNRDIGHLVDRLARRERGRLIAGLVRRLGGRNLELAEDVAQDALVKALAVWPYEGVPANPAAWLSAVARYRALDRLRRESREHRVDENSVDENSVDENSVDENRIDKNTVELDSVELDSVGGGTVGTNGESSLEWGNRVDPELHLAFLACHPILTVIDQLALTLRIVSGFTSREIAEIFLTTEAAIGQRQSRSKRKLKQLPASAMIDPSPADMESRLDAVFKTVYLMFSLGYAPRSGAQLIRRDVAFEALRLARHLAAMESPKRATAQALAALLSFQSSRFDAREDHRGKPILMQLQDRNAWDRDLIDEGLSYLRQARNSTELTRYHLEAGIASCYAISGSWEEIDWHTILNCYDALMSITDSPVVTINRCVALAFAGHSESALNILGALNGEPHLERYAPYHIALAEILRLAGRAEESQARYLAAIECGVSTPVVQHLESRLATNL